jgi:hypothetical protein
MKQRIINALNVHGCELAVQLLPQIVEHGESQKLDV